MFGMTWAAKNVGESAGHHRANVGEAHGRWWRNLKVKWQSEVRKTWPARISRTIINNADAGWKPVWHRGGGRYATPANQDDLTTIGSSACFHLVRRTSASRGMEIMWAATEQAKARKDYRLYLCTTPRTHTYSLPRGTTLPATTPT